MIKILFGDAALNLVQVDRNHELVFNTAAMHKIMEHTAEINRQLALFTFTSPGQDPRSSEFADHKIQNSTRPRTIFRSNGDIWLVTRRVKTENMIRRDVFIPIKAHPRLARIIEVYLLIIRPMERDFARILWGEEVGQLYDEYLWVRMGKRVGEDQFSSDLKDFTESHCGVAVGVRPYRQLTVQIARTYLGSEYEIDEDEDDVLAAQRGHGLGTSRRIYAPEVGHLPCMSSDLLLRFGHVSEKWWELTGFREGFPKMLPLHVRRQVQETLRKQQTTDAPTTTTQAYPPFDPTFLLQHLTATITGEINKMQVQLEDKMQKTVADGIAEAMQRGFGRSSVREPVFHPPPPSPHHQQSTTLEQLPALASLDMDDLYLTHEEQEAFEARMADEEAQPEIDTSGSTCILRATTPGADEQLQGLLRQCFPDKLNPSFKSPHQKEMVLTAMDRKCNFIAILPTGGGKSLVYLLPQFQEQDFHTFIVIPNKALMMDQIQRAQRLGIPVTQWKVSSKGVGDSRLVFVALETAAHRKFEQ